jgi:hypothetical protein
MKTLALIACLVAAACGTSSGLDVPTNAEVEAPARADEAVELLWSLLAADEAAVEAPLVVWLDGECMTGLNVDGCVLGLYHESINTAWVLRRDRVAQSQLPHELVHAALYFETADPDPEHVAPTWAVVQPLTALLLANGF